MYSVLLDVKEHQKVADRLVRAAQPGEGRIGWSQLVRSPQAEVSAEPHFSKAAQLPAHCFPQLCGNPPPLLGCLCMEPSLGNPSAALPGGRALSYDLLENMTTSFAPYSGPRGTYQPAGAAAISVAGNWQSLLWCSAGQQLPSGQPFQGCELVVLL